MQTSRCSSQGRARARTGLGTARGPLALALLASLTVLGCAEPDVDAEEQLDRAEQALSAAQVAIDAKWKKLGGAAVLGNATSGLVAVSGGAAQYQTFTSGAIVYSNDFGAVLLSRAILDKWLSLSSLTMADGSSLFPYFGLPMRDFVHGGAHDEARFERGEIITKAGTAFAVYGKIYERYVTLKGVVGLPTSEEGPAPGAGRKQSFASADIYWKDGVGAFAVSGAIRDRWNALGGSAGTFGYPTSDVNPVIDDSKATLGATARFEHGAIYASPGTGAWELSGNLLSAYETRFGGPGGWLGFPIAAQGTAGSGDPFVDFEGGVLVDHLAGDAWMGVVPFQSLVFRLNRLYSGESEGGCGDVDLYSHIYLDTPAGRVVDGARFPASGDVGTGGDANLPFTIAPVANSSISITASIHIEDSDGGFCLGDDDLGYATDTYSIDNLWGLLSAHDHASSGPDGGAHADFSMDHSLPFDGRDFRGQLWWSFHNFDTEDLTYDQYAATFADVDPDESGWLNPFNWLYFKAAYENSAENGNCFGMSLESIYAEHGRSAYSEPIHQYFPATQDGKRLTDLPASPARDSLINELNIKHGYQLGLDNVLWTIAMFAAGLTHDPNANYALLTSPLGENPLIFMTDDYLFGSAHTVRPYRWEYHPVDECITATPTGCIKVHIADPNYPSGASADDDAIEIDPLANSYRYRKYMGNVIAGGRMMVMPFKNFNHQPVTPFADVFSLIEDGLLFISGDSGATQQISDDAGHTLFEPGLSAPPTRWSDIRQDASARLPRFAPLMIDNGSSELPVQIFAGQGKGSTIRYETVLKPGLPAGTPYEVSFDSGKLSAYLSIPGTPGKPDVLEARKIGTAERSVEASVPAGSVEKRITFTVGAAEKQRWAELSNLTMKPAQQIALRLDNGGYDLAIDNNGPETTATLKIKHGPDSEPVVWGTITIPPGSSGFAYQLPITTLTLSNQVAGENGWLLAPVTVTLAAKDFSSKGIAAIETSKNQTDWLTYSAPFVYADEGATVLYYRARDKAGNEELPKAQTLKIDTKVPQVSVFTDAAKLTRTSPFTVHFSATDPTPGSGIATVTGKLDGTAVNNGQSVDLFWYALGTHTLAVTAKDVAGWSKSGAANFELIATRASLEATIHELRRRGEIDNDGIERSLVTQAQHNLNALLNHIDAQSGQHLSVRGANLLRGDVNYVIAHP